MVCIILQERNKLYRIVLRVEYRQRHWVFFGVPCVVRYRTSRGLLPTGGRVLRRSWDWPSPCKILGTGQVLGSEALLGLAKSLVN